MDAKENEKMMHIYRIASGVFFILLGIVLIINVGYVARAINFPFIYLLGAGSYVLDLFFIVIGVFKLIKKKFNFKKYFVIYLGVFISLLGINFIFTQAVNWQRENYLNVATVYNNIIGGLENGYFGCKFLNLFSCNLAGGFISYFLCFLFNGLMGQIATLVLDIIITLIGLGLVFHKLVGRFFKFIGKKIKIYKAKKEQDSPEQGFRSFKESDIYSNARAVGVDEISNETLGEVSRLDFENRNITNQSSIEFKQNVRQTGLIIKPVFKLSGNESDNVENTIVDSENTINDEKLVEGSIVQDPIKEESLDIKQSPSLEEKEVVAHEQMELDFNAPKEFNEELLQKQPEFVEPVAIEQPQLKVVKEPAPTPKKKEVKWIPPSSNLLNVYETQEADDINSRTAEERKGLINQMFEDLHLSAHCSGYTIGPSITRFHIDYDSTGLVKTVAGIKEDISRRLNGVPVRFEATVQGYSFSGLEVPNATVTTVSFKEIFESLDNVKDHPFNIGFGKDISGKVVKGDFDKFPHLLVSGTTGSGKSVFVNSIITTLMMRMSPKQLRLVLVDPKRVEMTKYTGIPHLLCPILNEPKETLLVLNKLCEEMNDRYTSFASAYVSDIKEYNEYAREKNIEELPYILVIVDEYADLTDNCKEIAMPVTSLSQKARAAGIHLLIATQRPTVNVITGTIKANINTRVALSAAAAQDSMVVLDEGGAEKLLGNGDMLVKSPLVSRSAPMRLQGCLIKSREIAHVVEYLKNLYEVEYDEKYLNLEQKAEDAASQYISSGQQEASFEEVVDDKFEMIKEWAMGEEYMSMSKIQRECSVGFNRAGRLLRMLQDAGVVSTVNDGPKGYKVIANRFNDSEPVTSTEQMVK